MDLTLNEQQRWICHKTQPTNQENVTHIIHRDFEIQTDHLISVKRPGLVLPTKKKNKQKNKNENLNCGLCCPGRPQSKIERK